MIKLDFSKYQGLGNDFIIFEEESIKKYNYSELAKQVCDRHFGIGADGMAIVKKDKLWAMPFYNADGSEAPMCGNASRCVAHYLKKYHNQYEDFTLVTKGADLKMSYVDDQVSVNLGKPKYKPEEVPVIWDKDEFISQEIIVNNQEIKVSAVFMTTSHSVVFVDDFNAFNLSLIGKKIENHSLFPQKINVNFVIVKDKNLLIQKTWERGVGMTLACGTGASASVAIANKLGYVNDKVIVKMDGGSLVIEVNENNEIVMQGKVAEIAKGQYFYKGEY